MLIERVIRNLDDPAPSDAPAADIDWLDLTWRDCARRSFRKRTRAGREVRALLPLGLRVRHHDVLAEVAGGDPAAATAIVAVNLMPSEVRVAAPADPAALARLALELGNLHVPVQVRAAADGRTHLLLLPDGPTDALLARIEIPFRTESCRFEPDPCTVRSLPVDSAQLSIVRRPPPTD